MAGYTRQDTANNIANGNVIDADDFDAEYNAIESAFNASTGHAHDGTAGGGAPIEKIGPSQDFVVSATEIKAKTTNTLDLGSNTVRFKDAYLEGAIDTNGTLNVGSNATVGGNLTVTGDATINGNLTFGDADTDSVTFGADIDSDLIPEGIDKNLGNVGKQWNDLWIGGTANLSNADVSVLEADTADIDGGTIDDTVIGGTTAAAITGTTITGTSFVGPLTGDVTGNVTGDVTGDLTGDVTGNVTGNLTGDVTGDITGDVTGNLTGNVTSTGANSFGSITTTGDGTIGGDLTLTGNLTVNGTTTTVNSTTLDIDDKNLTIAADATTAAAANGAGFTINGASATWTYNSSGDKFEMNKDLHVANFVGDLTGDVTGDVTGNVTGNVTGTASELETARTISLTGGVSGSASFDGSANISITTTLGDTSHTHVISDITGLQAEIDTKAEVAGSSSQNFSADTLNATTVDLGDWTITESSGVLYFATGGTNKMKLDASGNLTVTGDVTAYGTV